MKRALLVLALSSAAVASGQTRLRISPSPVVWIAGGWFTRGSNERDIERGVSMCIADTGSSFLSVQCTVELFESEWPRARVYVSPFGIDRTEVTNAAYRGCVLAGDCAPSRLSDAEEPLSRDDHPVVGVTFGDATRFCAHARGRLPTEAEWERATRGARGRIFPWGNDYNDRLANHGRISDRVNDVDDLDGHRFTAPVGSYPDGASSHGVLDLAGNVWEWTGDAFAPYDGARIDPRAPNGTGLRSARGGSFRSPSFQLRATQRLGVPEGEALPDLGFRCAYDPPRAPLSSPLPAR